MLYTALSCSVFLFRVFCSVSVLYTAASCSVYCIVSSSRVYLLVHLAGEFSPWPVDRTKCNIGTLLLLLPCTIREWSAVILFVFKALVLIGGGGIKRTVCAGTSVQYLCSIRGHHL